MNHTETTIDPVDAGTFFKWRFTCECGVVGETRELRSEAETDLQKHVADNAPVVADE